jgi:hypothetical protein
MNPIHRLAASGTVAVLLTSAALSTAGAQKTDTTATAPPAQPPAQPSPPALDFSGVVFGNYQIRTDSAAKAQTGGKAPNKFDLERVYLTFRMPVGDRASIRATTDIFQNANGNYYNGWTVRLKYGYLQYDYLRDIGGHKGFNALARIGMLHTVVIDHEEQFWPRYLGPTTTERFGFFSSSDLGLATQVALPNKWGEVYATLVNGPGYTSAETDRFKDVALRASFTPLAALATHPVWWQTFVISPWVYKGYTASKFAAGGAGQVGPVPDGLARDRWGVFAGVRDPRLTLGAHYARRTEGVESGANTPTSPRLAADSTGDLFSAYALVRPVVGHWGKNVARAGVIARWDRFSPRTSVAGHEDLVVAGLTLEPTPRTALTLDYQELTPRDFAGRAPIAQSKTWFLHWTANF